MRHVPGNHQTARRAVVDENTGLDRLPAHRDFLPRLHVGQVARAQRAGRSMKIDVVNQLIFRRILQRQFDVIAFMHNNHRAEHGTVEGKHPHEDARFDLDFFFLNGHVHLHEAQRGIKKAVKHAATNGGNPAEIRAAFNKSAEVNYIETISGKDLQITQSNGKTIVSFAYDKEIHLTDPAYLLIKYESSTSSSGY